MNQFFWPILTAVLSGALVQGGIALFAFGKFSGKFSEKMVNLEAVTVELKATVEARTEKMKGGCALHTGRCPLGSL